MEDLYTKGYTGNRELSWLQFDERCLEEAQDVTVPLLERMGFVEIFASNLDEFFMVRVGSLLDLVQLGADHEDPLSGMTPEEQLHHIYRRCAALYSKKDEIYHEVVKDLEKKGILLKSKDQWTNAEYKAARTYFMDRIRGQLRTRFYTGKDDFPFLENQHIYFLATLESADKDYYAIIEIPDSVPALWKVPAKRSKNGTKSGEKKEQSYLFVQDMVACFLGELMTPFRMKSGACFRITRNAEIQVKDEDARVAGDFRVQMQALIQGRDRQPVVRLEIQGAPKSAKSIRKRLLHEYHLEEAQCFYSEAPIDFRFFDDLKELLPENVRKALKYPKYRQRELKLHPGERIMDLVRRKDIFSCYPYDSMNPFLQLLEEASVDPHVTEIRMTIYRLSSDSKIAEHLARAAVNGKKVRLLFELRARFDEQNNIDWSKKLEMAGCKIYYGSETLDDYKVHSKMCQIVLNEMGERTYITQVGTGNYNEKTAKQYTDFSLITYNQELGKDIYRFFKHVYKNNFLKEYDHILAAPQSLKPELMHQMDREIAKGEKGRIFIKVNSVTDVDLIRKLSEASNAGVQIRMIVRGICCLVPGIPNHTENIEVVNVVGRYLEHSRVYIFGSGKSERMYISSADWMKRNTENRVELAFPILSPKVAQKIKRIMQLNFNDNVKGRYMDNRGRYCRKKNRKPRIDSQQLLMEGKE